MRKRLTPWLLAIIIISNVIIVLAKLMPEARSMADPKYLRDNLRFCLAHAIEECGEFLAAAGKTQRWGIESYNPELPPAKRESNVRWLLREMDDVDGAIGRLRAQLALEGYESDRGAE